MGQNSAISWTDHTFNGWWGCTKVSPACAHCYAETFAKRTGHQVWGTGQPRRLLSDKNWNQPLKWNRAAAEKSCGFCDFDEAEGELLKQCESCSRRPRVFCSSMADWLDDEVPIEWLARLLKLVHDTPSLDWLLLTKRPENWAKRLFAARNHLTVGGCAHTAVMINDWLPKANMPGCPAREGVAPANVVMMTTVENQEQANKRIPELLKIPAARRGLSVEPMLGAINLAEAYPEGFAVCSHRDCGHWGEWDGIRECVECEGREDNPDNGDCAKCDKGTMRDICPKCERSDDHECYEHPDVFAEGYEQLPGLHWVICGGESGPQARPMHPDWPRSLRDQCAAAGVPFHFKQWGEWLPGEEHHVPMWRFQNGLTIDGHEFPDFNDEPKGWAVDYGNPEKHGDTVVFKRVGKRAADRFLDSREWNEFPTP